MEPLTPSFELCPSPAAPTAGPLAGLSPRHRVFVSEFLRTLSAARAAEAAGCLATSGWAMLRIPDVSAAIEAELTQAGLTEATIVRWLQANTFDADLADYEQILDGSMSLQEARTAGVNTSRIVECKETRSGEGCNALIHRQIKLLSPADAADKLIKILGMITEKRDITSAGESVKIYVGIDPEAL